MTPLKLTIEGLYSYKEPQVIDFKHLTDAGLFGIFGAVGSGKTAILEAISYALYGETERMHARERRSYNMMNLKSNRTHIIFEFLNYENKVFRAERIYKRNSRNFDDVRCDNASFYEQKAGDWVPLDHCKGELLTGLSYANFKRTIIIPQGQFKEFLELRPAERTSMLKEIFNLHRFDLFDKVRSLANLNRSSLDELRGKLSAYEEADKEQLEILQTRAVAESSLAGRLGQAAKEANERLNRLKVLQSDFEALRTKEAEFDALSEKSSVMTAKRLQLTQYEQVYTALHALSADEVRISSEVQRQQQLADNALKSLRKVEHQLRPTQEVIAILQPEVESLPEKRAEENDLSLIVDMVGFQEELVKMKSRIDKGKEVVEKYANDIHGKSDEIEAAVKEIAALENQCLETTVMLQAGNWYERDAMLKELLTRQAKKVADRKNAVTRITMQLSDAGIDPVTFEQALDLRVDAVAARKLSIEQEVQHLKVQEQISAYAQALHDGMPCPLCGSEEHPAIAKTEDVTDKLQSAQAKVRQVDEELKKIHEERLKARELLNLQRQEIKQLEEEQALAVNQQLDDEAHQKKFLWSAYFDASNPAGYKMKSEHDRQLRDKIKNKTSQLTDLRSAYEGLRREHDRSKALLEELRIGASRKEGQINQNRSSLKVLAFETFSGQSAEALSEQLAEMKRAHAALEKQWKEVNEAHQELIRQMDQLFPALRIAEDNILRYETELSNVRRQIEEAIAKQQISKQEAESILAQKLDVAALRKEIDEFNIAFETLKNTISSLQQKLSGMQFNEDEMLQLETSVADLNQQHQDALLAHDHTRREITRLTKQIEEKDLLLREQEALQKREANLTTMTNLFTGAGFVQFISSIYLRQLCTHANVRFHRMTRNQLSLRLNDANEFEIVDYLNEGRSRSIKTLSGGQSFQVSLSLALALAESVQSHALAQKNFFFIDEGFGTQDAESVHIVFETLNGLIKENRIVGIISHVEELKEKIPVALNIVRDAETGSRIELI